MRKKYIYLLFGLIILLVFSIGYSMSKSFYNKTPLVENGFIDLSDWDFDKDGNVKLDGYWEFYPNELLSPSDINNEEALHKFYINTPGAWRNQISNDVIADKGIGTYRVKIKINKSVLMYGIKTTHIRSANKIFVNGKEIGQRGNPKPSFEDGYFSDIQRTVACFKPEGDTLDIIIQVANLDYFSGGIIQSVFFGDYEKILDYYIIFIVLDIANILILGIFGVYYIGIYLKNIKQKKFLYIGSVCIIYAFISSTVNERIFNKIFSFISYFGILKIKLALISLSIYLVLLLIRQYGDYFITRKNIKIAKYIILASIFAVLLIPMEFMGLFENIIDAINILICVLVAFSIIKAIYHKRYGGLGKKGTILLLCGVIAALTQYCIFILYYCSIIKSNVIPFITYFIFLLVVLVIILKQHINAYNKVQAINSDLISLDKLRNEFLISTSHEFKTPLHGIINIAQTILNKNDRNTAKVDENLAYIISTTTRLSSLVNDIIDFQSMQNEDLKVNKKVFDINGVVQAVFDILAYMRKNEEIQLINSVPIGAYYVYTDENRFKQILFNLIVNSLKYTENGFIKIKAEIVEKNYINITIEDTGIGIHEKYHDEIFERNIDIDKDVFNGIFPSGLGLSISKLLASRIGGELYLKWSEPDKGSIFVVKMPKSNEDSDVIRQELDIKNNITTSRSDEKLNTNIFCEPTENKSNGQKLKILLVDDDVCNIKVLQEIFYDSDYETLVAYNGVSALELIKKHKDISIVLLDVMMPGLSGYDVCKRIREEYKLFELPILLLTVRSTPDDISLGFEAGANDFLTKPFNFMELKARVTTLQKMRIAVKEALKMETVFLQSQIRPHFLYNALSVIVSLCYRDGKKAGELLGELSKYLRFAFDIDPYNSFVSLKEEISFVKSYVKLEKARFGERLEFEFDIDEECLQNTIPALVIQPLVENSIRHGLVKRISGGIVKISIKKSDYYIKIVIQDDGIGIDSEKLKGLLDDSISINSGLKNVNKRLINEYGRGIIIESKVGQGTTSTINIPLKLNI
ncbi:hybrid sensor histidine kinase/response regulator [Clostridium beijerinckii]|uniref:hybrid sensor histidine kinase/response regulator n=1 Tax=Clostridium beijerinckii TaxID=1520 RepID=UPI00149505C9|nr:ATP-binding protein [Clostridium beijerinckii]NOW03730.1 sensor histidine kinase YesM [Clostridium beijerinckii]NYC03129.1 sensor histidine kinase YesM [Clostridium beijerinckii]